MAAACRLLGGGAVPELIAMPSETEMLALHLVRALYDTTDGQPLHWRMSAEIDRETADAIEFAVARGWVVVEDGYSICLTDAGRRLVETH
jgi:hypothetical protein